MNMNVHIFRSCTLETLTLSLVFGDSIAKPPPTLSQTIFTFLRDLRAPLDPKTLDFSHCSHPLTIFGFQVSQGIDLIFPGVFGLVVIRRESYE